MAGMRTRRSHLFAFLAAAAAWACASLSGAPVAEGTAPALTAGATIRIPFPDMPATYYAVFEKKPVAAQMTVFLPRNYDSHRKFPLFVFLNGWDGGDAANPGVARGITQEMDFICVVVPLFRAPGPRQPADENLMRDADARCMWPYFQKMLARLDALVPNLDSDHEVLGGFSNGAHATQGLIDESDGAVARRFCAFLFVEGGGHLVHYDELKGKPYLIVSSNAKSRPRAQQLCDQANAAGAKASLVFVDIGKHGFPPQAYPAVREWLKGAVGR